MSPRIAFAAAALALIALLGGCTPESSPSPSASPSSSATFTSDAEAFAAAEKTYRAYVDALNERRGNPSGATDPAVFLRGTALTGDLDAQQRLDDEGLSIYGATTIASMTRGTASDDLTTLMLAVCLDSSETRILDIDGRDVTPASRSARVMVDVQLEWFVRDFFITSSMANGSTTC